MSGRARTVLSRLQRREGLRADARRPGSQARVRRRPGAEHRRDGGLLDPGLLDARLERRIVGEVVEPTLEGARAEGFPFRGVLYCGLMITADGPKALEYNVRFGDPETQAILRRFDGDFAEVAQAVAQGRLSDAQPNLSLWSEETATCVVMASGGYPGDYSTGKTITILMKRSDWMASWSFTPERNLMPMGR